ncbi:MAG: hypothetical protein EBU90_30360, partial [Proteobacteria bacterium]|nr:hypothetical protein [Pseudomonadota bacterium]
KTRSASTYRGAGTGTKERVSSGSYTPPAKKKAEKPADPWEGSATTPAKPKTKKATAPKAKAPTATKRKRKSKLDDLLASVRSESVISDRAKRVVGAQRGGYHGDDDEMNHLQSAAQKSVNKATSGSNVSRASASIAAKRAEKTARAMHPKPGVGGYRIEGTQIDEKTLTASEKKKREEIAQSMDLADFERRYPGRGMEVKMATATKMAKKMVEQAMELQPKTQSSQKPDQQQKKVQQQQDRMKQQEVQILQRKLQALRSAPKGTDPSIMASYEPEGEMVDESRAEEKRGLGSTGALRQRQKTKIGGYNPATGHSGGQNPHLRGKGGGTKEQRRAASRRYVDQPGGVYAAPENEQGKGRYVGMQYKKRDQSHMHSRFD